MGGHSPPACAPLGIGYLGGTKVYLGGRVMQSQTLRWDARPAGSAPPVEPPTYMSRVTGRTPAWKAHATLGQARGALSVRRSIWQTENVREIWVYTEGAWRLLEAK